MDSWGPRTVWNWRSFLYLSVVIHQQTFSLVLMLGEHLGWSKKITLFVTKSILSCRHFYLQCCPPERSSHSQQEWPLRPVEKDVSSTHATVSRHVFYVSCLSLVSKFQPGCFGMRTEAWTLNTFTGFKTFLSEITSYCLWASFCISKCRNLVRL